MDIALIIIAILLLLLGIVGCIVPALPGVPLSYAGLLFLQLTDKVQYTTRFLLIWGIIVIIVQVLDYFVPAWGTKRLGGSKWGVWGSTIGLIIGLFAGIWGIIIGPFIGALVFELIGGAQSGTALKAALGSFIGLLTGTVIKLICCGIMIYYAIDALL